MLLRNIFILIFLTLIAQIGFCQQWQWAKGINLPYGNSLRAVQVHPSPSGSFYISAYQWDNNYDYPNGSILIKYNPRGNELWRKSFTHKIRFYSMKVDAGENQLIAGDFRDTVMINSITYITKQNNDGFLMSLDSSGATNWFKQVAGNGDESVRDIYIDNTGDLFLTGAFTDQTTFEGDTLHTIGTTATFAARLDPSGNLQLLIAANTSSTGASNSGYRIRTDSLKNIYVLGDYNNIKIDTTSISDGNPYGAQYLAKFDSMGKYQFVTRVATFTDKVKSFSVCHGGVYLTGDGAWTAGQNWNTTTKYAFNGNVEWSKVQSGGFYASTENNCIVGNNSGLYIIGYHSLPIMPGWNQTYSLTLANITASGLETCMDIKTSGAAVGSDIARSGTNEFIIVGSMPDTINFGTTTLYGTNGNSFIAKFKESTPVITDIAENNSPENEYFIFPNPSGGQFNIRLQKHSPGNSVCVYDATGKRICSRVMNSEKETVDLSGQSPGLYFVNIMTKEKTISRKIILD